MAAGPAAPLGAPARAGGRGRARLVVVREPHRRRRPGGPGGLGRRPPGPRAGAGGFRLVRARPAPGGLPGAGGRLGAAGVRAPGRALTGRLAAVSRTGRPRGTAGTAAGAPGRAPVAWRGAPRTGRRPLRGARSSRPSRPTPASPASPPPTTRGGRPRGTSTGRRRSWPSGAPSRPVPGLGVEVLDLPGPHPGASRRDRRRRPGHRPRLRPPRQAASPGGVAGGARALHAGAPRRPPLRPGHRRRRLRRLRRRERPRGVAAEGSPSPGWWSSSRPARRAAARTCPPTWPVVQEDRGSPTWWSASTRAASPTTGCGAPRRCAGAVVATVRVEVLTEGVHSGLAGGVVPSSFRLLRQLLSRIEDERTGEILLPELRAEVPGAVRDRAGGGGRRASRGGHRRLPDRGRPGPAGAGDAERLVGRPGRRRSPSPASTACRRSATGATSFGRSPRPSARSGSRRRSTPTRAAEALVAALTVDPPDGARVTVEVESAADGWQAPDPAPWVAGRADRGVGGVLRAAALRLR